MKSFIATAVLAIAVQAQPSLETATVSVSATEVTALPPVEVHPIDDHSDHEHGYEGDDVVLMDYVDLEGVEFHKEMEVDAIVTKDTLVVVDDTYVKGDLVSVDGESCEKAIGHDGHYDPVTNEWMLEEDFDYEPEWRCLMRPLLREGVVGVE